jgi:hypothetical protein
MLVTLTEVYETRKNSSIRNYEPVFTLRQVAVNPDHVIYVREDTSTHKMLHEGRLPEGLDDRTKFSRVTINRGSQGSDITVVGDPGQIQEKLYVASKQLIKG